MSRTSAISGTKTRSVRPLHLFAGAATVLAVAALSFLYLRQPDPTEHDMTGTAQPEVTTNPKSRSAQSELEQPSPPSANQPNLRFWSGGQPHLAPRAVEKRRCRHVSLPTGARITEDFGINGKGELTCKTEPTKTQQFDYSGLLMTKRFAGSRYKLGVLAL